MKPSSVKIHPKSFTSKLSAPFRLALSFVDVSTPKNSDQKLLQKPKISKCIALWDTGSFCCSISKDIVKKLKLVPVGMIKIQTITGDQNALVYLVDLVLTNKVLVQSLSVIEADVADIDVIIGLDVISMGDFAISRGYDDILFSFRIPSCGPIDFTKKSKQ
jgi:hypothetical protein